MQEYLKHRKSLVSKGRKKPASATPSSSPSPTPMVSTVSSLVSQPVVPSVSDDQRIKEYVHSLLSGFFSQSSDLGTNLSFSAPLMVPHCSPLLLGATRGGGERGR